MIYNFSLPLLECIALNIVVKGKIDRKINCGIMNGYYDAFSFPVHTAIEFYLYYIDVAV